MIRMTRASYGQAPLRHALRYGEAPLRRALRYGAPPELPADVVDRLVAASGATALQVILTKVGAYTGPINGIYDVYVHLALKVWTCASRGTELPFGIGNPVQETCKASIDRDGPKAAQAWGATLPGGTLFVAGEAMQRAFQRYVDRKTQGWLSESERTELGVPEGGDDQVQPDQEQNDGDPRDVPGNGTTTPGAPSPGTRSSWWDQYRWWVVGASAIAAASSIGLVVWASRRMPPAAPAIPMEPPVVPEQLVPPAPRPRRPRRGKKGRKGSRRGRR